MLTCRRLIIAWQVALKPRRHKGEPADACRAWCFRLSQHKRFDHAMLGVIVANTCLMAVDSYGISDREAQVLSALNDLCTIVFIGEAVVKITGYGMRGYLDERWHIFDLLVVLAAVVDWVVGVVWGTFGENQPTLVRVLRLTRVLRTFRVVRTFRGLALLFSMLAVAVAGLINILCLYLILLAVYSLLAMQLFGPVPHGSYLGERRRSPLPACHHRG